MSWRSRLVAGGGVALLAGSVAAVVLTSRADDRAATVADAASETLQEQLARVAAIVRDVRGFSDAELPPVTFLEPGDLTARVADDLVTYTEEDADQDRRILAALRAIPPGYDLRTELVASLSAQVAGFYDPDAAELVVGAADPSQRVGRLEELTLAHELEHALADATIGLPPLEDTDLDDDALLAQRALVEGDANATMQAYLEVGFSVVDRVFLAQEGVALQEQLASVTTLPHHLQRSLTFPYEEGLAFVLALRDRGGWEAVDEAYATPPTTTAQIVFPERYLAGETEPTVAPGGVPGDGWSGATTTTLGAADLLLLFEAPGGDTTVALADPRGAVAAWRGGRLDLFVAGDRSAVSLAVATDRPDAFCRDLRAWLTASRPAATVTERDGLVQLTEPSETATLRCGEVARVGIAPTPELAARLVTTRG